MDAGFSKLEQIGGELFRFDNFWNNLKQSNANAGQSISK